MPETSLVIKALQASIGPCVLISGAGLLLLSMTNRIGRAVDRVRDLADRSETLSGKALDSLHRQVGVLYRRCRLLRWAIGLDTACIFLVSLVMLLLFAGPTLGFSAAVLAGVLFGLGLVCLAGSLAFLLLDVRLSLHSVRVKVREMENTHPTG